MSKNRIFAFFILFALLIMSAGVTFASDVDNTINEINDLSIDEYNDISYDIDDDNLDDADYDDEDDLDDEDWEDYDDEDDLDDEDWEDYDDEDDLDDEDWEDYDDEDDLDDEDWEDYDDEDDLDDEDWEDYEGEDFSGEGGQYGISKEDWKVLHDYYDTFYKNYTIKYHIYYTTAKETAYNSAGNYSNDTYSSEDNFTDDNETEEYFEGEIAYCSHGLYIATAAYYCPLMEDASGNQYQNYNPLSDDFDYANALSDLPSSGDDQNTSKTNGKLDVNKNIELANNSENSFLALFAVLIISILMIL